MLGSLFNKVAGFLKRDSNSSVFCVYCEIFNNNFFYRKPKASVSDSPTTLQ